MKNAKTLTNNSLYHTQTTYKQEREAITQASLCVSCKLRCFTTAYFYIGCIIIYFKNI